MKYPVKIMPDGDAFCVSSRDLPELNSVGYSLDEAMQEALDGIETNFMIYMSDRKPIPLPSKKQKDEVEVRLPVRTAAKVALYNEMLKQNVSKAELARRLGWSQIQVDRLWSLTHSTKLESIEAAFDAIHKELDLVVV